MAIFHFLPAVRVNADTWCRRWQLSDDRGRLSNMIKRSTMHQSFFFQVISCQIGWTFLTKQFYCLLCAEVICHKRKGPAPIGITDCRIWVLIIIKTNLVIKIVKYFTTLKNMSFQKHCKLNLFSLKLDPFGSHIWYREAGRYLISKACLKNKQLLFI